MFATNSSLVGAIAVPSNGTANPFTTTLCGLAANTNYWAIAYATNAAGTSYGDTITFTTLEFLCGTSLITFDDYSYATVQIGTQCWFAENLRSDNYRNGEAIPGNLTDAQWSSTSAGAQTVYGEGSSIVDQGSSDDVANLATYGRLYNWYAVNDSRGLCPSGFHVPTDEEWTELEGTLGGTSVAGTAMKTTSWGGTNSSGFSALPGGARRISSGYFDYQGSIGFWWSSSPNGTFAWFRFLYSGYSNVYRYSDHDSRSGFSVRCVRD
jgi:uncharacterized protein (TIGR02145 family)